MASRILPAPSRPFCESLSLPSIALPGWATALILLIAVLLIRLPHFGDPAFLIDEQFYLLVGDRMLHGALPYVDIWDRKPIGLFLIYAFARLFGGAGFWQYQLLAAMFAAGTAFCIQRMTRRVAGDAGALIAALLYLLWVEIAEGGGGQSPIFYNLPVTAAAMLILDASERSDAAAYRWRAFLAMGLVGLAIQIKYTVLAEGLFFGLTAAWGTWRRGRSPLRALGEIVLLAATALLPTLLALGFYCVIGQGQAFWFANFTSIFLRAPSDPLLLHARLQMALLRLIPLSFCVGIAAVYLRRDARPQTRRWRQFMLGWIAASLAGFFSVGVFYSHYILPLFAPLAAAAAPIFPRKPLGWVLAALCAWLPASHLAWPDFATTVRSQRQMAALSALVPKDVSRGCMQMFDGPPILYYLTNACTVSRFVFPDHLSASIEEHAIGADPIAEVRRILAARPEVITIGDMDVRPPNRATFAVTRTGLARDYRLVGKSWVDERFISVFVRR